MISRILVVLFTVLFSGSALAQNPISPPGVYVADPSARVWDDGKLYIYGSLDESTDHYCSHRHHVLSTSDMRTFTLHEDRFASRGPLDRVEGTDALLFAPDCAFKDGSYFLYYCLPDQNYTEGVARSKSPLGPFLGGCRIDLGGADQIDPAVFIDDDGRAYYIWGQFSAKMARLKPDMTEIDPSTILDGVVTEKEHHFHEGGWLFKREGLYYFVYAHMGRADTPTCLGYAVSSSVTGPYAYGGVIIDNDHCDPGNWNNHGSVAEFNGKWYVFYHRSTHGSRTMRKACAEPIRFNPDGSIDEVEMTSQGAGPPLDARAPIEGGRACLVFGGAHIRLFEGGFEGLDGLRPGDRAAFKYVDFKEGVKSMSARVRPGKTGGRIDLVLDKPWNAAFGSVAVAAAEGEEEWVTITAPVGEAAGTRALWLRFHGEGEELFSLDRFWFRD